MGIFQELQKEKEDIHDLTKRVGEFVEGAGKVYEQVEAYHEAQRDYLAGDVGQGNASGQRVLNTSIALKLKAGASLKAEIKEKVGTQKNKTTAILLEQLSMTVSGELSRLNQVRMNLMELQAAQEAGQVVSKEETMRKLKAGMDQYAGKQGSEE